MKNAAIRSRRLLVTHCADRHVVLVFRDSNGVDIGQAHLDAAVALSVAADIQRTVIELEQTQPVAEHA